MPQSSRQTGNPCTQGTVALCAVSRSAPSAECNRTRCSASFDQPTSNTDWFCCSQSCSARSLRLPTSTGAKPRSASVCNPSERKGIRGERPTFTSILQPSPSTCTSLPPATHTHTHTQQISSFMDDFIYKQDPLALYFSLLLLLWKWNCTCGGASSPRRLPGGSQSGLGG